MVLFNETYKRFVALCKHENQGITLHLKNNIRFFAQCLIISPSTLSTEQVIHSYENMLTNRLITYLLSLSTSYL